MSKQHRPGFVNHPDYLNEWMRCADMATAASPQVPAPPAHLLHQHGLGAPACGACWDTGLCAECLGRYPQYCPVDCGDGMCGCAAGEARRAAYAESLRAAGLAA